MQNILQNIFYTNIMSIKELLHKYNVTQQELADFMGVPRGRVSGWLTANKDEPPFMEDAKRFELVKKTFASLPLEKVKSLVQTHRIIAGNIEPLAGYDALLATGIVSEPEEPWDEDEIKIGTQFANDKGLNSPEKTDDFMINKILSIIEHANRNMEKIADANLSLSRTIEQLTKQHSPKETVS